MQIKPLHTLVLALSATQAANAMSANNQAAALGASDVVASINKITDISGDTTDILKDIGSGNFVSIIPNGIRVVKNFASIIKLAIESITMLGGDPGETGDAVNMIVGSISSFIPGIGGSSGGSGSSGGGLLGGLLGGGSSDDDDSSSTTSGSSSSMGSGSITVNNGGDSNSPSDMGTSMSGMMTSSDTDFSTDDQNAICSAFHGFVEVHQDLLSVLIGKNGILSKTPITKPIGGILRVLEGGVDMLANGIIGLVPTCSAMAKKDLAALDKTLGKAKQTYSYSYSFTTNGDM